MARDKGRIKYHYGFYAAMKDFLVLNIDRPQIMSMAEFLYRFA